jgi:hypothetical protein
VTVTDNVCSVVCSVVMLDEDGVTVTVGVVRLTVAADDAVPEAVE